MAALTDDLKQSLSVVPLKDDQLQITVTLSADLLPHYAQLFEALTSLVKIIETQARSAAQIKTQLFEVQRQEALHTRKLFCEHLVAIYDRLIDQGLTRTAAIKQISVDLRKENHPWAADYLVRSCLIDGGRPGKPGRKRTNS